jgi:hypothetical protein
MQRNPIQGGRSRNQVRPPPFGRANLMNDRRNSRCWRCCISWCPMGPWRRFSTLQGLALLSWTIGRNVQIDTRWAGADSALFGSHPAEAPTKYETVINLTTTQSLGLTIPETLLATADEVIK